MSLISLIIYPGITFIYRTTVNDMKVNPESAHRFDWLIKFRHNQLWAQHILLGIICKFLGILNKFTLNLLCGGEISQSAAGDKIGK